MLNGSGDTDGNVQLLQSLVTHVACFERVKHETHGSDDLARLADLHVIRAVASVDSCARCTHTCDINIPLIDFFILRVPS